MHAGERVDDPRQLGAAGIHEVAALPARGELLLELEQVPVAVERVQALEEESDALLEAAARLPGEPADVSEAQQMAGCLSPMIERLPEAYRDAIVMTELQGQTQRAAALSLGISVSGMKSRVQRARQQS